MNTNSLRITPTFIAQQAWIESILAGLFGFAMIGVYPIVFIFFPQFHSFIPLFLIVIFLSFLLPMWGYVILKKKNYNKTYYEFDADKVIYYDGFFNITRKEIFYNRLIEVNYNKNFIQQNFDLGTITLSPFAMPNATTAGTIKIRDIANPEDTYEKIKSIVYAVIRKGAS